MDDVIAVIDKKIALLQQAKAMLTGGTGTPAVKSGRGRPKGSKNATKVVAVKTAVKKKRQLTPEGRKAIADAMKRRWAERRKLVAK